MMLHFLGSIFFFFLTRNTLKCEGRGSFPIDQEDVKLGVVSPNP